MQGSESVAGCCGVMRASESAKVRSLVNGEVNRGEGRKEGREEPLLRTGVGAWGWSR